MSIHAALEYARKAIIGLGYVGLPLAEAFGRQSDTLGFEVDPGRIAELMAGQDHTHELGPGARAITYDVKGMFPKEQVDGRL
jgi:UDP-N-acetyl-D-galactosamine dehydrogenase